MKIFYLLVAFQISSCFEILLNMTNGCGNAEFDIHFMTPIIIIYEGRNIFNVTITDTMNLSNPISIPLKNKKTDVFIIDAFPRSVCTKRLLLDVC